MTKQVVTQKRLYLDGTFTNVKSLGDGVYEGIVATNSIDRHGEALDINGLDTKAYMDTNPVVLFGHDYSNPENVIGKALTLGKTKMVTKDGVDDGGVQLSSQFQLFTDIKDTKATLVAKLIKKGVLALSIGFVPKEIDGDTYTKSEMAEFSVVPVPANAEAAITARSLALKPKEKALLRLVFKGAISSDLPAAPEDTDWDGGAAVKAVKEWASNADGDIDFTKYRKAFFWVDPAEADKQGGYKLPFATVIDGKLTAVWDGVAAAYAAVQGARGGVKDIDKDAVLTQIKKYYGKFDKDWPADDTEDKDADVAPAQLEETDVSADPNNADLGAQDNPQNPGGDSAANTVKAKGAIADELAEDKVQEQKSDALEGVWEIYWAFCDVVWDSNTSANDIPDLIKELISLLQQVADGTYKPVLDDGDADEYGAVESALRKGVDVKKVMATLVAKGIVTKDDDPDNESLLQQVLQDVAGIDVTVDRLQAQISQKLGVPNPDVDAADHSDNSLPADANSDIVTDDDGAAGNGRGTDGGAATNTVKELTIPVTENGLDIHDLDAHSVKQLAIALKRYAQELEEDATTIASSTSQGDGSPTVRKRKLVLKQARKKVVSVDKLVELTLQQLPH